MYQFYSMKFNQIYLGGYIPSACKIYRLHNNDAYMNMLTCIIDWISPINDDNVFTIVVWYKRDAITDKCLIASINNSGGNINGNNINYQDNQVESGYISYHIILIVPPNRVFIYPLNVIGRKLKLSKLDVNQIQTWV